MRDPLKDALQLVPTADIAVISDALARFVATYPSEGDDEAPEPLLEALRVQEVVHEVQVGTAGRR